MSNDLLPCVAKYATNNSSIYFFSFNKAVAQKMRRTTQPRICKNRKDYSRVEKFHADERTSIVTPALLKILIVKYYKSLKVAHKQPYSIWVTTNILQCAFCSYRKQTRSSYTRVR